MDKQEQDVKQESSPESVKEPTDTSKPKEEGSDRAIPYERFKEKVSEVKDLKKQIEKLAVEKEQYAGEVAKQYQTYYESEMAKLKRTYEQNDISYVDPSVTVAKQYDSRVDTINTEITNLRKTVERLHNEAENSKLQSQVEKLKSSFPEMDEEHVYAIKKLKPDWDLEECAEYSHKHFENAMKTRYEKMLESKKQAAKKPIFGDGGKINIKPEDRPKTMKDARAKMMAYAAQLQD